MKILLTFQILYIKKKDQNSKGNKTVTTEVFADLITTDNETDSFTKVGPLRKKHITNLLFGHLNSLRNETEYLRPLIRNHFHIF